MSSGWHAKYGLWSTEVCEVSLTKNLRGKPDNIRLGKSRKVLRKILCGYLHWENVYRKLSEFIRILTANC